MDIFAVVQRECKVKVDQGWWNLYDKSHQYSDFIMFYSSSNQLIPEYYSNKKQYLGKNLPGQEIFFMTEEETLAVWSGNILFTVWYSVLLKFKNTWNIKIYIIMFLLTTLLVYIQSKQKPICNIIYLCLILCIYVE